MKITPPSLKLFVLWCTDAVAEFFNGCCDGILIGSGGGIATVAQTDTTAPSKLVLNGAIGFAAGLGLSGLSAFKVWHKTNRMPNPFRDYSTPSPVTEPPSQTPTLA